MKLFKNRHPDQGIVYKGAILECWLPSYAQSMLRYDKNHLPVVQLQVEYYPECTAIFDEQMVVYAEFKHKYKYE